MEHSANFPDAFYRVTIKGLCVRDGKLLMIRESDELSGSWELPGGGLDFGEDIYLGFNRETEEEMGLKITKMSKAPVYVWTYRYKGRRELDWFYSCVICYRIEFEHLDFTPMSECQEIAFFSHDELKELGLNGQMGPLAGHFDPNDFITSF